jgi:hypothetical protein
MPQLPHKASLVLALALALDLALALTPAALAQSSGTAPSNQPRLSAQPAQPDAPAVPSRAASDFRPSLHGFAFVNSFTGSPLPAALRELKGPLGDLIREGVESGTNAPSRFGLCGGMSLAAADLFLERTPRPAANKPPAPGTDLYEWLHRRQESSLGSAGLFAIKFMTWMMLPDAISSTGTTNTTSTTATPLRTIAHATYEELGPILKRLDEGELAPLGLVYVRAASNSKAPESQPGLPWENHQVLAYQAQRNPTQAPPGAAKPDTKSLDSIPAGKITLWIYDPNYPNDDDARIELEVGDGQVRAVQVTGSGKRIPVRGVMAMPWVPQPVPAAVSAASKPAPR